VRSSRVALALLCLSFYVSVAVPQSLFDFDDWMQRIDDQSQDLQRHIGARNVPAAKDSAREIEELYDLMEKFFEKRGEAADAVRWSREGADWARQAQLNLDAKKFTAAKRNALAIAHGCRDCHYHYKPL
jgi:cytochrome c553